MNEFANLLSELIKEKDVKVQAFAKYCGYDRANMYKILKGQRTPSDREIVEKAAKYMHLLPSEEEKLWEAYEISVQGYDNYYRRKDVEKFFSELLLTSNLDTAVPTIEKPAQFHMLEQESIPLRGTYEVDAALFHLIGDEIQRKDGHLRLLVQPESNSLSSILAAHGNSACQTRVDHIVCLSSTPKNMRFGKNYNLDCLRSVLPLYNYHYDYHTWYYYSRVPVQERKFSLFPYMILSSKYACVLTADMQKGYITAEEKMLQLLGEIFEEYLEGSKPMIRCIESLEEQFEVTGKILQSGNEIQSFQMTPCLTPVLTDDIYEKYIKKDLPGRAELIRTLHTYGEAIHKAENIHYITSMEGIRRFLDTGMVSEWPQELYEPLETEDRVRLVRELLFSGKVPDIRILKKPVGDFNAEIYLCVSMEYGVLKFIVPGKNMQLHLVIEETGLLFSFFDFCENFSGGGKNECSITWENWKDLWKK